MVTSSILPDGNIGIGCGEVILYDSAWQELGAMQEGNQEDDEGSKKIEETWRKRKGFRAGFGSP
jgi:hypothetical protein